MTCLRQLLIALAALALSLSVSVRASEHAGIVTFNGVPVPGASVTATRGETRHSATSAPDGSYVFDDLPDGTWTLQVDMRGFVTSSREVSVAAGAPKENWALSLEPFEEMARHAVAQPPPVPAATVAPAPAAARPAASTSDSARPVAPIEDPLAASARSFNAADGLLINGSVNNGAASPFAQMAAFGNNRRGRRSLYNGGLGIVLGNSAWDARPYSFSSVPVPKPSYDDVQILGTFGGPVRIPRITRNGPTVFVGYQRVVDHNATTQSVQMPTRAEREGDFSGSLDAAGNPVQISDPTTGQPFQNNQIPRERLSPQAQSLLDLYPGPNIASDERHNYQTPVLSTRHQDGLQTRATQTFGRRDSLAGSVSYLRTATDGSNAFGFVDSTLTSATDAMLTWSHRFSQFATARARYQYARQGFDVTPYFSNRENISGVAGITGNNQEPVNWGPPNLSFSSGLAGLSQPAYARNVNQVHTWSGESLRVSGRHTFTTGGGWSWQQYDVFAQQNARGGFGFTGALTGSDLADFLLGLPTTSAIAFGNADKLLEGSLANLYFNDDWRVSPSLTINAGVRWEYESPMSEAQGRLSTLDATPDFSQVGQVRADDPSKTLPDALIHDDWRGIQPRIGSAWRPIPGSSLVVRAGYGIYRNTGVYSPLALLLAQQPPFSKTSSVSRSPDHPLTLADGFLAPTGSAPNTFAIDPAFRVGYAHTWQTSVQRDLPGSLTVIGTYTGTAGRHLLQEFLPNTYPTGSINPCPSCPAGFVYLASNGSSLRNAGQVQLRRRLRNGLTASVQYTLAKATDNAAAFVPTGATENLSSSGSLAGATIAQDWLNLDGEYGPSSFDQRHVVAADVQYTTGMGIAGGALMSGWRGKWFKGWTLTSQLTTGSGPALTPIYLAPVTGTGVTGTIRGSLTGEPTEGQADGSYANPAAYAAPPSGTWGNAGRNSIRGPAQFNLNAGIGRSFLFGERFTLDWRLDASNVLNRVTYSGIDTLVGSPQFGLADRANTMRKIQTSARLRF